MNMSLSNGVDVFLLIILVLSNLKSTTGLFLSLPFLVTNMTGEVCVVLFLVRMPNETSFCIHLSIRGLSSSAIGKGLTKKVEGSFTSMLTFISGHFPILSKTEGLLVIDDKIHDFFLFTFSEVRLIEIDVSVQYLFISHVPSRVIFV